MSSIKVGDEVYNLLKALSDKTGKSIRELIENAVNIVYKNVDVGYDDIVESKQAFITVKYKSKCSLCGREINVGELALWVRYKHKDEKVTSKLVCLECFYQDKSIAKLYLKKKELEAVVRGLKKMADELAEQVNKLQNEVNVLYIRKRISELLNDINHYLKEQNESKLIEILDRLDKLEDEVSKLKAKPPIITKSTRKERIEEIF